MTLRFGTSEAGGTFHTQAVAIAELFNRRYSDQEKCAVTANLVTLDDVKLLERGELDFGLMASNWIGQAKNGDAPFDRPIALRMIAPANAGPVFFVTLANSPIRTASDLVGKRIALGPRGSGMAQHAELILKTLGISVESFTPVFCGFDEAGETLIHRGIDALWQRPIPNRAMTELSQRADVRIIAYAAGELERVIAAAPFYRQVVIEKGAFRGVIEDSAQVGVVNVVVTHEQVAESSVCAMARTLVENLDILPTLNPLFKSAKALFEPLRTQGAAAFEFGGVALHRGALQAYKESGWLK